MPFTDQAIDLLTRARARLSSSRVACIGPITANSARGHSIRVDAEATEYTIPGLVEAVAELFSSAHEPAAPAVRKDG